MHLMYKCIDLPKRIWKRLSILDVRAKRVSLVVKNVSFRYNIYVGENKCVYDVAVYIALEMANLPTKTPYNGNPIDWGTNTQISRAKL